MDIKMDLKTFNKYRGKKLSRLEAIIYLKIKKINLENPKESTRTLAKNFGWGKTKAAYFLRDLKNQDIIQEIIN